MSFAAAFVALPLCFACVSAGAEPFIWFPTQPVNGVSEDLELAVRARKVLLQSELLAGQIVGVRVRNRVATLWGTVSSASVARAAEECLSTVPGLTGIRSELSIDPRAEFQSDRYTLPGAQSGTAGGQPQMPDTRRVQGALVHHAEEKGPTPSQEFSWRPAGRKRAGILSPPSMDRLVEIGRTPDKPATEALPGFPLPDSTRSPSQAAASKVPQSPIKGEESVPAMPGLIVPVAPTAADSARSVPPPPLVNPQHASSLVQAVEALRLADDRFRLVRVEVRGDTVYLRGTVYHWDHLFELARSIARLPGVRRVLFEGVREAAP